MILHRIQAKQPRQPSPNGLQGKVTPPTPFLSRIPPDVPQTIAFPTYCQFIRRTNSRYPQTSEPRVKRSPSPHSWERLKHDVGIPDENSLRPRTWKLLLRLIPAAKKDWDSTLYEKRCQYYVNTPISVQRDARALLTCTNRTL